MTKSTNKYVSVNNENNSLTYREVAEIMSSKGDKMNHATVRNIVLRGLTKVAKGIASDYNNNLNDKDALRVAKSPDFQNSIIQIIKDIDEETKL